MHERYLIELEDEYVERVKYLAVKVNLNRVLPDEPYQSIWSLVYMTKEEAK